MKIINHVTREEIGEISQVSFKVDDAFMIPLADKRYYFLVTGVEHYGNGKLYVFEMTERQYKEGKRIKDLLV